MEINRRVVVVLAVLLGMGSALSAQEEMSAPCRESVCQLEVMWRDGAPVVIDGRYGNAADFERHLREAFTEAGYFFAIRSTEESDVMTVRVRPEIKEAMCDRTAGYNTDMGCQTVGELRVEIVNIDAGSDIKNSFRIRGRCGADQMMTVARMGEYSARVIIYELLKGQDRDRPRSKC